MNDTTQTEGTMTSSSEHIRWYRVAEWADSGLFIDIEIFTVTEEGYDPSAEALHQANVLFNETCRATSKFVVLAEELPGQEPRVLMDRRDWERVQ